ncbi:MAG: Tetratricopeptide TPR_2 repeat-containing protein [Candidatus Giovannonibacteria bacterium GW2011_GWA2_44_13b]|nr:MAG: Tetratricopeptide TPR_2 repeat-containing protein [Candidatus Giovannonibacteria bacterium GW2011_GWA2_44_13b]
MSLLFLPLMVSNKLFFPFISGKNLLFRAIVEILFALWTYLALKDERYRPRKSWIFICVTAVIIVLSLSTVFSVDANRSLWSNFERMEGLVGHVHLYLYFVMLIGLFRTEKDWWKFFHVSIAASLIAAVYSFLQLGGALEIHQGGDRIDATLGNATYLSVYLLFHLFLLLYYYLKASTAPLAGRKVRKIAYGIIFAAYSVLLYHTATRGSILGFLGGLFLFALILGFTSREKKYRIASAGLISGVLLLVIGFYFLKETDFIKNNSVLGRFRDISLSDSGNEARFIIWNMAFQGFKEHPVLGWGMENFNLVFNKYYDPSLYTKEPWFDRAHNVFLDWLVAAGILGLLAYLGVFASSLYVLWKKRGIEFAVFVGLLGAYFFQNLFVFDQLISYLMFFAVLAFIHSFGASEKKPPVKLAPAAANALTAFAVIIFVFVFYNVNVKAYFENRMLIEAFSSASQGPDKVSDAFEKFKKAIAYNSIGTRETREQLAQLMTQISGRNDIPQELKSEIAKYTISEFKKQLEISPTDTRYHLFLAVVYNAVGDFGNARASIQKALLYSPKKQQIKLELVQSYYLEKDFDKAIELMQSIIEEAPNYPEAMSNLILISIVAGYDDLADKEIAEFAKQGIFQDDDLVRWANAYASRKRFDKVIPIYEELFRRNPADTQTSVNLAAAYVELGEKNKAVEVLRKAIAQTPAFKDQGEKFIQQILK